MTPMKRSATYLACACLVILAGLVGCTAPALGPANVRVRSINQHALWAIERGLWREAGAALEQAALESPDHPGIQNNLGIIHEFLGDTLSARQRYEAAVRLAPTNKRIRRNYEEFVKYKGTFKEYDLSIQGLRTLGEALGRWSGGRTFRFQIKKTPVLSLVGMHRLGIITYQKSAPTGLGGRKDFSERISDAMRLALRRTEDLTLVPDQEMRWALNVDRWDSTTVKLENLAGIGQKLDLEGLIILQMEHASTGVVPGGLAGVAVTEREVQLMARRPRFNVQMSVTMRIVDLDSLKVVWEKRFEESVAYRMDPGFSVAGLVGGIGEAAVEDMAESIAQEFRFYLAPGATEVERRFLLF